MALSSTAPYENEAKAAPTAATSVRKPSRRNVSPVTSPEDLRLFLRAVIDKLIDAGIPITMQNGNKNPGLILYFPTWALDEEDQFIDRETPPEEPPLAAD